VSQPAEIDVVIRSTLELRRKGEVLRAIESVKRQTAVRATPVVVANGERYDASLMDDLSRRQDIRFAYFREASPGRAMRIGREAVTAPFFAFLDDDDEFLPNALSARLEVMQIDAGLDVVVTTGFFEKNGELNIHIPNIAEDQDDPLFAITKRCWLSSCGGLFRSRSVTADYFDGTTDYQELTLLAFKLVVAGLKIRFLNQPTYIVHDTPGSLSKSHAHVEASELVIGEMLSYRMPAHVRRSLQEKYRNTLHVLVENYGAQGLQWKAWRYHLRSMTPPHTFKYLAYTRKLIAALIGG
jgi:hypothetical protein